MSSEDESEESGEMRESNLMTEAEVVCGFREETCELVAIEKVRGVGD